MAYKIPLFNLNFDEREAQAAYDTIKSGWISTGPKNAELEQMFIDMWKVKYAVSMSNCTDALHVCCMVCGFGPGDEVIIDIWGANENSIRQVISPDGSIQISGLGPVHLNGMTIKEANKKKKKELSKIYSGIDGNDASTQVKLTLGNIRSIQININIGICIRSVSNSLIIIIGI